MCALGMLTVQPANENNNLIKRKMHFKLFYFCKDAE